MVARQKINFGRAYARRDVVVHVSQTTITVELDERTVQTSTPTTDPVKVIKGHGGTARRPMFRGPTVRCPDPKGEPPPETRQP
jgi:hypothetical protein